MSLSSAAPTVSVIVPVGARKTPLVDLYAEYKSGLESLGMRYEVIFVLDGPHPQYESALLQLVARGEPVSVVSLTRYFGEATALMIGFEHATGSIILTLPAYLQVEGQEIGKLIAALEGADIAIGYREPRASNLFQTARRRTFHGLLRYVTRLRLRDLGCNVRALKRRVLEEIRLYGDQERFLPVLAERQGFRVAEVAVRQSKQDRHNEVYRPRNYLRGFLDIFNVFFLVRFTKRPLRFFGMIGVATLSLGMIELLYLIVDRVVFHSPLADRPALILASLLIVLGVQIFALGLLGELVIFTHAGGSKDYQVDRVIQYPGAVPAHSSHEPAQSNRDFSVTMAVDEQADQS
ncbi:MAG: glycosyltransferase [Steroidobacteraceae bacterium]|jgi:glycosyltransferase involved in cell wall biosynthesis